MEELIREYKEALREVNKAKMKATDEEDKKLLSNCADSLRYAIEYMEKGKPPENRRGITRLSGLQREYPTDPEDYDFIVAAVKQRRTKDNLTTEQKQLLNDIMGVLTEKQKEAYFMVRANGYSFGEAAKLMKVHKGTVQRMVMKAEEKIAKVIRMPSISEGNKCSVEFKKPVQRVMF